VDLSQAVEDEDTLLGAVLIHSYAIAEAAASDRLSFPARDVVTSGLHERHRWHDVSGALRS
jgi:hypothetical protein